MVEVGYESLEVKGVGDYWNVIDLVLGGLVGVEGGNLVV